MTRRTWRQSLKDGRSVYIGGQLVDDVTVHPAFGNSVHTAANLFDALKEGYYGKF